MLYALSASRNDTPLLFKHLGKDMSFSFIPAAMLCIGTSIRWALLTFSVPCNSTSVEIQACMFGRM